MNNCIDRGLYMEGTLPAGLRVRRRPHSRAPTSLWSASVRIMLIIGVMPTPLTINTCMSAGLPMVNAPYGPSR